MAIQPFPGTPGAIWEWVWDAKDLDAADLPDGDQHDNPVHRKRVSYKNVW
jgi:hypothetical protein